MGLQRRGPGNISPNRDPLGFASTKVDRGLPSYIAHYSCSECGRVDTEGTRGPPVYLAQQPVVLDVTIGSLADRWYCAEHSAEIWGEYLEGLRAVQRRRDRLARWMRGELEWQKPKRWVQMELF